MAQAARVQIACVAATPFDDTNPLHVRLLQVGPVAPSGTHRRRSRRRVRPGKRAGAAPPPGRAQTVWRRLTGESAGRCPRRGAHWERLGFQGLDPATDLRSCGMLGLLQARPAALPAVRPVCFFFAAKEACSALLSLVRPVRLVRRPAPRPQLLALAEHSGPNAAALMALASHPQQASPTLAPSPGPAAGPVPGPL